VLVKFFIIIVIDPRFSVFISLIRLDQDDRLSRALERQDWRRVRWNKRPRYSNPYNLQDPEDDPLIASIIFDVDGEGLSPDIKGRLLKKLSAGFDDVDNSIMQLHRGDGSGAGTSSRGRYWTKSGRKRK